MRKRPYRVPLDPFPVKWVNVERTFTYRTSGKDTTRPRLAEMLAAGREGDTVLVHSMDGLARTLEDLGAWCGRLPARGCGPGSARKARCSPGRTHP